MLRCKNYTIDVCDKIKTKQIAGRIIPAVSTTTAAITGLVALEFIKLAASPAQNNINLLKNSFINLALPLWILSQPVPPIQNVDKVNPKP